MRLPCGRLAANPGVKVLLLEAGETDELELVMNPNLWVRSLGSELDWDFRLDKPRKGTDT
jgi:choline dehydrogenase